MVQIADPRSPSSPGPADIHANLNRLSIQGPAKTEVWDHQLKVLNGFCLMRMVLHSGTKETGYSLHWVDEKTLKIKLKWPFFMQNALFMTGLDVSLDAHDNTLENYPEGHQVYTEMGKNSKNLEQQDGLVYSEGLFQFRKPMDQAEDNKCKVKVFERPVDANGNKGTVLQIAFLEKNEDAKRLFASPPLSIWFHVLEMQSKNIEYLQSTIYSFMLCPGIGFHLPLYPSNPISGSFILSSPLLQADSYLILDSWSIKLLEYIFLENYYGSKTGQSAPSTRMTQVV
eukprot:jgi/Psemu1/24027/gm1.24027_g